MLTNRFCSAIIQIVADSTTQKILGNCVTVAQQTLTLYVGVRIPIPQSEKSTSVYRCAFFNEAHLRCMKNEARLRLMKRAFGSRRALRALRFTRAQRVLHGGNAAASCLRSKRFVDKILFLCYNNLNK